MNIKFDWSDYANVVKHPIMGISFHNWIKLLAKNRFNISIGFIPKVLFLTGNIVLNIPFQLYEYIRFSKKIKQQKIVEPVFILGNIRSGTTYLHYVLSKDTQYSYCTTYDALVPHVFLTSKDFLRKLIAKSMPSTRPQDNVKMTIDTPKEEEFAMANISQTSFQHCFYFPKRSDKTFKESVVFTENGTQNKKHWKKHYQYFLQKLSYKYNNERLLMKSPANTGRMKELYELYLDAKFIYIHRNPYDVYASSEGLFEKILPLTSFQKISNEHIENFIIDSYEMINKKYLQDKPLIPNQQLFEMRYEDFVNQPTEMIEKAYNHLNIKGFKTAKPFFDKEVSGTATYKKNKHQKISNLNRAKINTQWKFAFDAFGYEVE